MNIKHVPLLSLLLVVSITSPMKQDHIKLAYQAAEQFLDRQEHLRRQYRAVYVPWGVAQSQQYAENARKHGLREAACLPLLQASVQNPEILEGRSKEEFCDEIYNQVMETMRKDK